MKVKLYVEGLNAPNVPSPEIPDNTMNVFKAFFQEVVR